MALLGGLGASSGMNLNKSLESEAQLANLTKSGGASVAGNGAKNPLRDAPWLVAEYGDKASKYPVRAMVLSLKCMLIRILSQGN